MVKREQNGLYNATNEHDACGVGMVVNIHGNKSHELVDSALKVLENMRHRGAEGADNKTGDGAGIMLQIPHEFILLQGIPVPEKGKYGTGLIFLPKDEKEQAGILSIMIEEIEREGLTLMHLRNVPTNPNCLGKDARATEPDIKQVFITGVTDVENLERTLYVIRKKIEKRVRHKDFYIVSLSGKNIIYKGMLSSMRQDGEEIRLVRYRYDDRGDMVETTDALDVSKHFVYTDGHLLVQLTNQGGMSFHWEYEGKGENARCVHTWGDGGVMEYFIRYGKGYTHIRNGEGAETEYHYGEDKLIYKIVDANGGITRQQYNGYQELEVTVNPEGYTRKTSYNEFGQPVRITDENGEDTFLSYDGKRNLVLLCTPGGKQLSWDYDGMDRVVSRTTLSGETVKYTYEGGVLHTITDGQGRVYTLTFNDRYDLELLRFPNGLFRRWEYDGRGRLIQAVDVKGNATRYAYDRADNLIRLEEPDGNVHRFEYDAMGNMVHATDNIREVKFTYGALGVLKSREQERHRITFGYNSELQLRRIGNEAGDNYFFELDGLGQVVTEIGFDGLRREYERDGAGRVTRVNRPGDKWTEYLYDGLDNILKEEQYDGEVSLYTYDKDGMLVKAENSENLLEFTRDRKTGQIIEEKQGEYTVNRTYDSEGNCTRITSSLGADIRHTYDREGNLQTMQAGESWQASWVRDNTGLEVQRTFSGGVTVRTERDCFGREVHKSVRSGGIEKGAYRYQWGIANRLLSKENDLTGTVTRYDYDRFDFLIRQETMQGSETDVIYRVPDFVGNLFETPDKKDRKYGAGGKLLEDQDCFYHYDDEGNLIFREFKQLQETGVRFDRKRMEKERGIHFLATGTGWLYEWSSNGMLKKVIRPDGRPVEFRYDALGRRTAKQYFGKVTRWVWDGNVPIHEWGYKVTDMQPDEEENTSSKEPTENITTWVFEAGTFIPTAKIQDGKQYSIVSDYLGTPIQMYDEKENKTWDCTLDIYGKVATFEGRSLNDCPFRFQGQYEDEETGLYYNRFRYYISEIGGYLNQDLIGLTGNNLIFYNYVKNPNTWIDIFGLFSDLKPTGDGHHLFPRAIGDKLGIRDIIEKVSWYPNVSKNTASLHQELHAKLRESGIPIHGSQYQGTIEQALDAMDNAYKSFDTKGYLMIDGKRYDNLTPSEAMVKVRQHVENKIKVKNKLTHH